MFNRNTWTSLALILALVASPALAADSIAEPHQPAGAAAMPGCMMSEAEGGMPMMRMMMGQNGIPMIAKHMEGRLAFLKTLKITDAQLPLWNAFAQAMRDNATAMQAMPDAMMGMSKAATLPDKLTERETMLTARIEAARELKGAADPLYAALDADQRKTADEIMLSPMGMMM